MIDLTAGFTLVREFPATPEELWRFWTDPAEATHWMHPRGVSTPQESIRFDVRPGGRYEYVMVDDRNRAAVSDGRCVPGGGPP